MYFQRNYKILLFCGFWGTSTCSFQNWKKILIYFIQKKVKISKLSSPLIFMVKKVKIWWFKNVKIHFHISQSIWLVFFCNNRQFVKLVRDSIFGHPSSIDFDLFSDKIYLFILYIINFDNTKNKIQLILFFMRNLTGCQKLL